MEKQPCKRQRFHSLEPNKIVQYEFTRNYVHYLVPALMEIKEKNSAKGNIHCDFKNVVKHEVDLAMVFSAQGFAWSNGLKLKLEKDHANVATNTTSFVENEADEGKDMEEMKEDIAIEENEDEEDIMKKQLRSLRRLIPGGEGICDEEMVAELESYISCLQIQVNVLQCLLAEAKKG
ncbi:PREDICTED: uncharacterized protein At4g30180-like [Lupinus angustifolius]|uniref:uncharacterized protein At4g30180-like n=1 Tax=Lupinus angustifolius TaxID=3871 RepID=UPI00092E5F1A|nr:PREDICTED: uncharacterized protein At4g30180-like [Lupinus angustifolius]